MTINDTRTMETAKMIEPFTYDVSSVQERLIWGGAPAPGPSAAAISAVNDVCRLFPNDKPAPAPNSNNARQQSTQNSSGRSRL